MCSSLILKVLFIFMEFFYFKLFFFILNYFIFLILKINLKNKKYYINIFLNKNILKNINSENTNTNTNIPFVST